MGIDKTIKRYKLIFGELYIYVRQFMLEGLYRFLSFCFMSKSKKDVDNEINIACIVQVKNEEDIVEDWILYNLYLFGDKNIYILDDGSTDGTRDILNKYSNRVNLTFLSKEQQGLYAKRKNISDVIEKIKSSYDYIVPIDADEFVVLINSANRDDIVNEFKKLDRKNWGVFKFKKYLTCWEVSKDYLAPVSEIRDFYFSRHGYWSQKVFLTSQYAVAVGEGQHNGYSDHPNTIAYMSPLCLVHFDWRGFEKAKQKCEKGAAGFNFWKDGGRLYGIQYKKGLDSLRTGEFQGFLNEMKPKGSKVYFPYLAEMLNELKSSTLNF